MLSWIKFRFPRARKCLLSRNFFKGKKQLCVLIIIVMAIFFLHSLVYSRLDPWSDEFTDVNSCPACYGSNFCPQFYHGDVSLIGISQLKYFKSVKNVFMGKLSSSRVVLKKLAHDWELEKIDHMLCEKAKLVNCDSSLAIQILVRDIDVSDMSNITNFIRSFDKSTDVSQCLSSRFINFVYEKLNVLPTDFSRIAEVLYGLLVNPEAIFPQVFPQSEGWPFPHYYGSCGRVIVEEFVGRPIAAFENSPWEQRVDIAYQLLQIAQMLTENTSDYIMYLTDVNMDNFAVKPDGTVLLIDVENIVIVDRINSSKARMQKLHHSRGEHCKDCLNFSYEDLCNCDMSDHNYYAVCKGLLVPDSYYSSIGLLHDIPSEVNAQTNLSHFITECANPSKIYNRFIVVPQLLQILKSLL